MRRGLKSGWIFATTEVRPNQRFQPTGLAFGTAGG